MSGIACHYRAVVSLDLHLLRESIHSTTLPNPDPDDKPFYVPAGTKYVLLARLEIDDSPASSELHILSSWCIDVKISGDLMVSATDSSIDRPSPVIHTISSRRV